MKKATERDTPEISLEKALAIFERRLQSQTLIVRMSDIEALDRRINETPSERLGPSLQQYEKHLKGIWQLIKSNIKEKNPDCIADLVHQGIKKITDLCPDDEVVADDGLRQQYWGFLSLLRLNEHPAVFDIQISSSARIPVEIRSLPEEEPCGRPDTKFLYYTAGLKDKSHDRYGSPVNHTETYIIAGDQFLPSGPRLFREGNFLVRTGNGLINLKPKVRFVTFSEACYEITAKQEANPIRSFTEVGCRRGFHFDKFMTTAVPKTVEDAAIEKFGLLSDLNRPKTSGLPYGL